MARFLKGAKRWLPGALISLVLIAAIVHFVDLPKVVAAIRHANYGILALVTVLAFAWMFVRAIVWRTLLRDRPPYRETLLALSEGYLLNNFLPFRLGELGRAFLLSRKTDMKFAEILPTVVIERAVDLFVNAVILLGALPFVVGAGSTGGVAVALGSLIVVGLVLLYVLARNRSWALDLFHRWPGRNTTGAVPGGSGGFDGHLGFREVHVLDCDQLGDGDRDLLPDRACILPTGDAGVGHVCAGRRGIWGGDSLAARRRRHV